MYSLKIDINCTHSYLLNILSECLGRRMHKLQLTGCYGYEHFGAFEKLLNGTQIEQLHVEIKSLTDDIMLVLRVSQLSSVPKIPGIT